MAFSSPESTSPVLIGLPGFEAGVAYIVLLRRDGRCDDQQHRREQSQACGEKFRHVVRSVSLDG
ncbi:hypothetical protein ACVI1I_004333 [Bradyrhizobium sp. USDA 4459]